MKDTSRELQLTQQSLLLASIPTFTQTSYYCNSKQLRTLSLSHTHTPLRDAEGRVLRCHVPSESLDRRIRCVRVYC